MMILSPLGLDALFRFSFILTKLYNLKETSIEIRLGPFHLLQAVL